MHTARQTDHTVSYSYLHLDLHQLENDVVHFGERAHSASVISQVGRELDNPHWFELVE